MAVDIMIQRLERLHERLKDEGKDREDLLAFGEALRIVRCYFGK